MAAAASKPHLRAVPADEKPQRTARKRKLTVSAAASRGSRLELLVAMRDRVAKAVEAPATPARDLASLTRRLLEITKDIDVLNAAAAEEAASDGDADDEPLDPSAL